MISRSPTSSDEYPCFPGFFPIHCHLHLRAIMTNTNMNPANEQTKRKIIIFSDFDGTIFMQDTGHILFDAHGVGAEGRAALEAQMKTGEHGFVIMQQKLEMDPGFREFHAFCRENGYPFNVISAGLRPILKRVLDLFLGEKEASSIDIVANDAIINPDGSEWKPIWRHDTDTGHDKALSVNEARAQAQAQCEPDEMPLIVFIGDGVSDLPAAREADVLFARERVKARREIEKIAREDQSKTGGVGKPVRYNPRANMWRRISSKEAVPQIMAAATPSKEEKMFLWPETFSEYIPKTIQEDEVAH
ncbi:Pdp3-interacting factor 1 [Penicillium chermesinum]|uniref:Pdp3-interacting factor 1 n=1 Tax=Penicillium chermesinum TaxID=63820 RepID=A0A9W9PK10_9EURO|nr:Pdp3-interacting factor 1 [Penicillium chermesinum]KAJ5247517.1 Pdp3-interacting factor 1 [Penicillium chermesinum]